MKQAVLNHRGAVGSLKLPNRDESGAETEAWQPGTKLGRDPPPKSVVPLACPLLKISGKPRWNVVTPSTPHPETTLSVAPRTVAEHLARTKNVRHEDGNCPECCLLLFRATT